MPNNESIMRQGTHFGGPVTVDARFAGGLLQDVPIDVLNRAYSNTLILDWKNQNKIINEVADTQFTNYGGNDWNRVNIRGTAASIDFQGGAPTGRQQAGLRLRAGNATPCGVAFGFVGGDASATSKVTFFVDDDNTSRDFIRPISFLHACSWSTSDNANDSFDGTSLAAGGVENDVYWGLMAADNPTTSIPISTAGALNTGIESIGWHAVAGTDAFPQPRVVGSSTTTLATTLPNRSIPEFIVENRVYWFGFRVVGINLVEFYLGWDSPENIQHVATADLGSASNPLTAATDLQPMFAYNQGDDADTSQHPMHYYYTAVSQTNFRANVANTV